MPADTAGCRTPHCLRFLPMYAVSLGWGCLGRVHRRSKIGRASVTPMMPIAIPRGTCLIECCWDLSWTGIQKQCFPDTDRMQSSLISLRCLQHFGRVNFHVTACQASCGAQMDFAQCEACHCPRQLYMQLHLVCSVSSVRDEELPCLYFKFDNIAQRS